MPLSSLSLTSPDAHKHSPLEDLQGLSLGVFTTSLALTVLTSAGLVTGQIAGLAAIVAYISGWGFGPVFFAMNLPFFYIGYRRFGAAFTLKSFAAVTAMSAVVEVMPLGLSFDELNTGLAALIFGVLAGFGVLAVFRHGGSLGGIGIIALMIQDRFKIQAGYVQLGVDAVIFAIAFALFPWTIVAWSLFGAFVMNLMIAINHRRDRYIAA